MSGGNYTGDFLDLLGAVMFDILFDTGILGILNILDRRCSPRLVDWIRLSQGLDAMLHFRWRALGGPLKAHLGL